MIRVWEKEPFKRFQSTGKKIAEQQIFPCSHVLIMAFANAHLGLHLSIAALSELRTLTKSNRTRSGATGQY